MVNIKAPVLLGVKFTDLSSIKQGPRAGSPSWPLRTLLSGGRAWKDCLVSGLHSHTMVEDQLLTLTRQGHYTVLMCR